MNIRDHLRRLSRRRNTIDKESRRALLTLADLTSPDGQGVSVTYLSSQLTIEPTRLLKVIDLLAEAEYLDVKKHDRVKLVRPTLQGYEKAAAWRKETREKTLFGRIPALVKWLGAGVLAALLALGLYWLGLVPGTSDLQPYSAAVPMRVYDMGSYPLADPQPGGLAAFPLSPGT